MRKLLKFTEHSINVIMVTCLSFMVILVFTNVVLRYVFSTGIASSEEISRFLFVWLTFIGAIVAFKDNEHLGVDSLVRRLPIVFRKIFLVISNLLMMIMCILIFDGSWKLSLLNLNSKSPSTGLPLSVLYAAGVLMSMAVFFILLMKLYKIVLNKLTADELIAVKESEELIDYHDPIGKEGKPV